MIIQLRVGSFFCAASLNLVARDAAVFLILTIEARALRTAVMWQEYGIRTLFSGIMI